MITPQQRAEIESKLDKYFWIDGTHEIDDQGLVSVKGHVQRSMDTIVRMPVTFDVVSGDFQMDRCALKTLQGFPRRVGGNVSIARTSVSSLESAPDHVGGSFWAYGCLLKNLEGAPRQVMGKFVVYANDLKSFDHIPQGCTEVDLPYSPTLPVLKLLIYPNVEFIAPAARPYLQQAQLLTEILAKYAGTNNPGDVLRCASELNEHGFEGNAEW